MHFHCTLLSLNTTSGTCSQDWQNHYRPSTGPFCHLQFQIVAIANNPQFDVPLWYWVFWILSSILSLIIIGFLIAAIWALVEVNIKCSILSNPNFRMGDSRYSHLVISSMYKKLNKWTTTGGERKILRKPWIKESRNSRKLFFKLIVCPVNVFILKPITSLNFFNSVFFR